MAALWQQQCPCHGAESADSELGAPYGSFGWRKILISLGLNGPYVSPPSISTPSSSSSSPQFEDVQFIDVREDWEFQTARLPHFKLWPLSKSEEWVGAVKTDLDPSKETVVLCHHGMRSMSMANYLVGQHGFTDVKNVTGGISAYSMKVDRSIPNY